jgi:RNA polymerase sigma-70 factor (ECF subfamily)
MPVSTTSDEVLVARMAARDQEALSAIYDRYRAVVFSLALRILKDRAEAEEALADVFLQAWRQAHGFDRARGSAGAWLITLCRSRAIDRLRARGRRAATLDALARAGGGREDEPSPPAGGGPEEAADLVMKRRRIGAAIGALSPEQRRALELAYYEGLSHSEIATALGEPLGTVKTRIRQGLITLRQKLSARFES